MNKASLFLGVIAVAALALAAAGWITRPEDLSLKIAELEAKLGEANATIMQLRTGSRSTAVGRAGGNQPIPLASASDVGTSAPGTQPLPAATDPNAQAAAQATNVAPQDAKMQLKLAAAEVRYADLMNQLQLQPDERNTFKHLASRRFDIRDEAAAKLMDPSLTPEQRQEVIRAAKAEMAQNDASFREFLNDDNDYGTFMKWDNSEVERGQVELGRKIFENDGAPITPEQQRWLVDSLATLRSQGQKQGVADPYNLESVVGTRIDQGYVQNVLAKFDRDTQLLLQNARSQFTPIQLNSLNNFRTQQRTQIESRLWNLMKTSGQQ